MLRRLYMLFPSYDGAKQAVNELMDMGINESNLHTIAHENVDISGLPKATVRQKNDAIGELENQLWTLNLIIFFVALVVFVASLFASSLIAAFTAGFIMAATFFAGHYFASHIPHAHLEECHNAIKHGEILLLVDIPRWKIPSITKVIHKQHPDMELGGVTWILEGY